MSRFAGILENFTRWGQQTEQLSAALIIGSQARNDHPADDHSDLDLLLIVNDPAYFLSHHEWLNQLGKVHISFEENTICGGKERRILFGGALDVDFVLLPYDRLDTLLVAEELSGILSRGFRILIDKIGLAGRLPQTAATPRSFTPLPEEEFVNLVNDFWFHTVWTAKKLLRGELWTAKSCLDSYLKGKLLLMLECHAHALHGITYDTWHSGRFLEEWTEPWILEQLPLCFSAYGQETATQSLFSLMCLFRQVSVELSERLHYRYPKCAEEYATSWVQQALSGMQRDIPHCRREQHS